MPQMKDFTQMLKAFDGTPIEESREVDGKLEKTGAKITLASVCLAHISASGKTGQEAAALFDIGKRIGTAEGEIEMETGDLKQLTELMEGEKSPYGNSVMLTGQAWRLLQ